jgi:isopenicillin N synthase-like dioxygenase
LLPGYRAATQAYIEALAALGFRLLRLLALSLDLPPDSFDPSFSRPMYFLRPLHYNAQPSDESQGRFAAGAHSDYGMLTMLTTDGVPGLQICTDGTSWRDVPPLPHAFIVNLGDMLARWTNGRYRSTLHRVMGRGRERHSIAFFFEPNFDARVEALPQCLDGGQPLFPPTTAGQHLLDKYHATHAGYAAAAAEAAPA